MTDDTGTGSGRGTLRDSLPRVATPPELENRIRASLATRGLIAPSVSRRPAWAARVGLLAAGFLLGALVRGNWTSVRPAESDGKPGQYALLLYGVPPEDTGAVHVARAKEYGEWASRLRGARWVGGHELAGVVETLGPERTSVTPRDQLAGFFIIEAPSAERAAEVARSCPHLKYGGRVVVMSVAT
jgi:hypothetical protein